MKYVGIFVAVNTGANATGIKGVIYIFPSARHGKEN
jgi:hypothetical protein